MSRHKDVLLAVILILALVVPNLAAGAEVSSAAQPGYFVRVPAAAVSEMEQLGIQPILSIDYGVYTWLELSRADTLSLQGRVDFIPEPDAGVLVVPNARFDPVLEGEPVLPAAMRASGERAGFHLVQFIGPVKDQWLDQVRSTGASLLQYYPHNAYLVWATSDQADRIRGSQPVRWTGLFHPAYKLNSDLAGRSGSIQNVAVFFYNDGHVSATIEAVSRLGGRLLNYYPAQPDKTFYEAIYELDAAALEDIARLDTVLWLGYSHPEPVLDDEMSDQIVAGNYSGGVPFTGYQAWLDTVGVDGTGVIWAIIDTGVDYDHPDLGSHIVGGYDFPGACSYPGEPGSDCPGGGHGTHVAGITGGDATGGFFDTNGFLYGLGVAPEYSIFAMNSLSASAWPPTGGWQEHSKRAVLGNAIGGNNSWTTGEGTAHGYQSSERTHDIMVLDGNFDTTNVAEPFIEVFSAGNSGPGSYTLTAPKEAKNLTVVASSRNYRVGSIDDISGFSSRGPAVDGRYVPTIATPGEQIASSRNDDGGSCSTSIPGTNNLYAYCSGTSMASPHASGAVALITEWWRSFNAGANPSSAMAKALLVNGAVDMGSADIPNFNEGWGRVHLANVVANNTAMVYFDQTHLFQNAGETWSMNVRVMDPDKPLKVTLAWADAPGAIGANPALVNNLDLTIVNGANTYYGNHFSAGWSTPGGSPDAINNLENVYIQDPASSATITVQATNLPGDAVLYNADPTDQAFALVCYNCDLGPDFSLVVAPDTQAVCASQNASYDITLEPSLGFTTPVDLSAVITPSTAMTTSFSAPVVVPPGSSTLTVGNTAAAVEGSYTIVVTGETPTRTHSTEGSLDVYAGLAAAPELLLPADGAADQSILPTFTWAGGVLPQSYDIEIARDAGFTDIVDGASDLSEPSYTPLIPLETAKLYYWRVRANNPCGAGAYSEVWSFTTKVMAADCPVDKVALNVFVQDFEAGEGGWTHSGNGDTWGSSDVRAHSGVYSLHAEDSSDVSDQRLVSPEFELPVGAGPLTLQFWNYQEMEFRAVCYDGGLLEVSTDGGASWAQVEEGLLTDPYDGPIQEGYYNPLSGKNAWCGNPQDWLNSVVALDAYAGQAVQFRFRLGTDNSVGGEGWYVDDFKVQSCVPAVFTAILGEDSLQAGMPGETVTHTYTLRNLGLSDTYSLSISGNTWETRVVSSPTLSLGPGESAQIAVQVEVPESFLQTVIATDVFTLTAVSAGDPLVSPSVSGTTDATATAGVALTATPVSGQGAPGGEVAYVLEVSNMGSYTDTFTLSASGVWAAALSAASTGPLGTGDTATVTLLVTIPEDAASGQSDVTTVTAVSSLDGTMSASAQITTEAAFRRLFLPIVVR